MVVGKKAEFVKKILYILSYFIRCSDVLEATEWGSLEGYMKMLDFTESSVDAEKTPTPANSCMSLSNAPPLVSQSPKTGSSDFTTLNPDSLIGHSSGSTASGGLKFEPLNPDSVENDCNSNHSGDIGVNSNSCEACNANRNSSAAMEGKFGKSVFYMDSKACSCDNLTNRKFGTGPNPIESSNLEKGKSCDSLLSKKRSFSLKLDIPNNVESQCNHIPNKKETPDSSVNECKLSVAQIVEDTKIHNVKHVRKSSDFDMRQIESLKIDNGLHLDNLKHVGFTGSDTKLTAKEYKECIGKVMTKAEIKAAFLKKGSNSMFDEYFKDNIETKTIDDLDEKDLVHELRPVNKQQQHVSNERTEHQDDLENSIKAPSMPDLSRMKSESSQAKLESEKSHRSRLGSLDQSFRSRKKSFNRQISESGAKTMKGGPGRCRYIHTHMP